MHESGYFCHVKRGKLIIVSGPTASGKSALAVQIARRYALPVVSADSRQVYIGLDIGTAKISTEIRSEVPHYLIDILQPEEQYNAGRFVEDVHRLKLERLQQDPFTLICGGTGLYIQSLLEGVDRYPEVEPKILNDLDAEWKKAGLSPLAEELKIRDPQYAEQVDLSNPHRILRALSIIRQSGMPFSFFQNQTKQKANEEILHILLEMPRDQLYKRIDQRVEEMLSNGLEEETIKLQKFWELPALNTVGYKEMIGYLNGSFDKPYAIQKIQQHSRNYAKRQLTWYRKFHQGPVFHPSQQEEILRMIDSFLEIRR